MHSWSYFLCCCWCVFFKALLALVYLLLFSEGWNAQQELPGGYLETFSQPTIIETWRAVTLLLSYRQYFSKEQLLTFRVAVASTEAGQVEFQGVSNINLEQCLRADVWQLFLWDGKSGRALPPVECSTHQTAFLSFAAEQYRAKISGKGNAQHCCKTSGILHRCSVQTSSKSSAIMGPLK